MDLERKLRTEGFTLEDFRDQLRQIRKMGPLEQLVDMLPKVGPLQNIPKDASVDEGKLKQVEAIINSMTNQERLDHNVIDGKRRKREPDADHVAQRRSDLNAQALPHPAAQRRSQMNARFRSLPGD